MVVEQFGSAKTPGKRSFTRQELESMKRNMKKVPLIQKKSENYHKQEEVEAENLLGHIEQRFKKSE